MPDFLINIMTELTSLLQQIKNCTLCNEHLLLGPNPVVQAEESASILIIGQAPGTKVHASGIPWDDASGKRLREWLQIPDAVFYDPNQIAIMPMGFCYPGKGKSGDLPPRPECAPQWHQKLIKHLPNIELTLLIGQYAQQYYLNALFLKKYQTLTQRVRNWRDAPDGFIPLPHPSPRNQIWLKKNDWFKTKVVPSIREEVHHCLKPNQSKGHHCD